MTSLHISGRLVVIPLADTLKDILANRITPEIGTAVPIPPAPKSDSDEASTEPPQPD